MLKYTGTYTDYYQLAMSQVYFRSTRVNDRVVFDYFFRKLPFSSGYAIFAGLDDLLSALKNLKFDAEEIEYLKQFKFDQDFLDYLRTFRFHGDIYSCHEGEVVFPTCPIVRVEANLIEAQIIESLLLNILNFQTLIATKASRMRLAAGKKHNLLEFGLRRAQGAASYYASRAAIVGGFDATSHVRAGFEYDIPVAGTMAHSFVQSYDDELSAFRDFARCWPDHCVLLVDTYNTLKSGIPNAITVAKEMAERGHQLKGIRLDSGDLAYLANKARQMLDDAALHHVKIIVSNQLDEHIIKSLLEQHAPIDHFGVGTSLSTGHPDAALDGVYKLAQLNEKPCIKLSDNPEKITLPYRKKVYRVFDDYGQFMGVDCIALDEEPCPDIIRHPTDPRKKIIVSGMTIEPLLHHVFSNQQILLPEKSLVEIAQYREKRLSLLHNTYKRFQNPHGYKVGVTPRLFEQSHHLMNHYHDTF